MALSVNIHVDIYITVQRPLLQETFKVYFLSTAQ